MGIGQGPLDLEGQDIIGVRNLNGSPPGGGAPAFGELTMHDSAATITMTVQNTWYPVTENWNADEVSNMTLDADYGQMIVERAGEYETLCSIKFTSNEQPNTVQFGIFKNDVLITDHKAISWLDTTEFPNTVCIAGIDALAVEDVLDLRVRCTTGAGKVVTISDVNFNCFLIGGTSIVGSLPLAAPADGALSANEVVLWFDATNGASKLMIKGKSANGTVVTGQVALS